MNKEDRYSHLVPMDNNICCWSPYCRHTTQTMVIKLGKNNHLCWDGSTTKEPTDIVMNQVTPMTSKASITFGHIKMQLYIDIYNTCISYPNLLILLAMAEIKVSFCFGRIHADLAGSFGFLVAGGYFNLATAMVFGLTASAFSWESFCCAIKALSIFFDNQKDFVYKHRKYLDMLSWANDLVLPLNLARAIPCLINEGVLNKQGDKVLLPA